MVSPFGVETLVSVFDVDLFWSGAPGNADANDRQRHDGSDEAFHIGDSPRLNIEVFKVPKFVRSATARFLVQPDGELVNANRAPRFGLIGIEREMPRKSRMARFCT